MGANASGAFNIASGTIGTFDLGLQAILSGNIGSGQIGTFHISSGAILSGKISSGQIGQFHHASGSVTSGHVGDNSIVSGSIASGTIGTFHFSSGGVLSGNIASGQIGPFHLGSGSILSGHLASGQVSRFSLASGLYQYMLMTAADDISGFKAVCVTTANTVGLANAASGLRLPAVGIVASNVLAGATVQVIIGGANVLMATAGLDATWSGFAGRMLYAGSGGMVVTQSGLLSGMAWQRLGVAISGGISLNVSPDITSGGVTVPVLGADRF